jgi:exonuclease VII large subunit
MSETAPNRIDREAELVDWRDRESVCACVCVCVRVCVSEWCMYLGRQVILIAYVHMYRQVGRYERREGMEYEGVCAIWMCACVCVHW